MIDRIDYPEKEYKHYNVCTPLEAFLALPNPMYNSYYDNMKQVMKVFLEGKP
jgi:hypothetical protein